MKTLFKLIFWIIGIVILLVVIAAVAIPLFFNPNHFKPQIEKVVQNQTGRDLTIAGDIQISYFPWLGLKVGRVELANPPELPLATFASIEQADFQANIPALLRREIKIDTVVLHGLIANLSRDGSGQTNWEDLAGLDIDAETAAKLQQQQQQARSGSTSENAARSQLPFIREISIGGIDIRDASIDWHDEQANQHYRLSDFSLQSGVVELDKPVDIDSQFNLQASNPDLSSNVSFKGQINFDRVAQVLKIRQLDLQTNGLTTEFSDFSSDLAVGGDVEFDLEDQKLAVQALNVAGRLDGALAGTVNLQGDLNINLLFQQYRINNLSLNTDLSGANLPNGALRVSLTADTALDLIGQSIAIDKLSASIMGVKLNATIKGEQLLSKPVFSGPLEIASFNPRELLQQLGQSVPATSDPSALGQASLAAQFVFVEQSLALDPLIFRLDQSTLQGKLSVLDLTTGGLHYQLKLDAIDADRYLPPRQAAAENVNTPGSATAKTAAQGELPLEPLRQLNLDGALEIGQLKINQLQISNVSLPLQARNGSISLSPARADLYGGRYRGNIGLDVSANQPRISLNEALSGIQAGPLLQALAGEDRLSGTVNATAQLTMQGASPEAIRSSLNGVAQFEFKDGAYKGVNIAQMLRQAQATLSGQPLAADDAPLQTDFSELSFTLRFQDGQVFNEDLSAKSPLLRITGAGNANLVSEQLDYGVTATAVATAEGQGGASLTDLQGIAVPIRITGTFSDPQYGLDIETLAKAHAGKLLEEEKAKLAAQAEEKLRQEQEKLQQKLEDKLGEEVGEQLGDQIGEEAGKLLKGLFGN